MTAHGLLKKVGVGGFRMKLLVSMMVAIFASTGVMLWLAQRHTEAEAKRSFQNEFQGELGFLLGTQETRRAAIAERCRLLAKSVRIRASLEENDVEDLYLNARVEFRDLLEDDPDAAAAEATSNAPSLRAKFFRFLNQKGEVMSPPDEGDQAKSKPWEGQLAMPGGLSGQQQIGYAITGSGASEALREIIATPIIATDTGEIVGEIVLGFKPVELGTRHAPDEIKSGIWLSGQLQLPTLPPESTRILAQEVSREIHAPSSPGRNSIVQINGAPYLLFDKLLNPGSRFPPAYQVCLYPLADSLARQRQLRWRIVGSSALVLLAGLIVCHFVSRQLSAPVEKLAEDSAENLVQRERAETALDLTHEELRIANAGLEKALADLKATQQQIIQQERLRALGQMASGIAHDFNNALVPILGFCELLQIGPEILKDRQKALGYISTIETAAKDAASVVSRLREFYRPDKTDRNFATVNLKRLVEQAVTLTKPRWKDQVQAKGATVQIVLELTPVPGVSGEESALREVLTNLIFNAVDAMPTGGTLTLRTFRSGDSAVFEVADSGTGMSDEVRQRCLDPFFSTKGEHGTGLGLSMVFGIVERHSGVLAIRSEVGKGTTFSITLPLQEAPDAETAQASGRSTKPRSLHVLVVDDEAPVRDTLAAVLATEGHEVELAHDGLDGLRRFTAGKFDLVVTDKAMPNMSGDQMAATIKQISPGMPIILLTGFGLFHDQSEFPEVNVVASKPIRIPALREAIATAMEGV